MANYILNAVGPSGGPQLCNTITHPSIQSAYPDICSTKTATCCHTPLLAVPYSGSYPDAFVLLEPSSSLGTQGFYENYNSDITADLPACTFSSGTGSNVTFKELGSAGVTNAAGGIPIHTFYINYGATITLDFSIRIPYIQTEFQYCHNLGRLEMYGINPDNRGILYGDHWYNNYPGGTGSPFITPYDCSNNPSITPISYPYESPYPNEYWADINSFSFAEDIESYRCNYSNYCCACYEIYGTPYTKSCTGSCDNNDFECTCSYEGQEYPYSQACYSNVPYVTLQGSYIYTCDVLCGVRLTFMSFRGFPGSYYQADKLPGEKGFIGLDCTTENCLPT